MGKKDAGVVRHRGKKAMWSGRLTTRCGLVFEPGSFERQHWGDSSPWCPACDPKKK
jgi:hypothetical protein